MKHQSELCGCFPTGRHYPGIADRIVDQITDVPGLCVDFEAGCDWRTLPLAVIDFETTGTDPENDRVLEIGVVFIDQGQVTRREALLVNPGIPVSEDARAVHGITDEELHGAPSFIQTLPVLASMIAGRLPVAYNAAFDRAFLHKEFSRCIAMEPISPLPPALQDTTHWIDPLVWARELLAELKSKKLTDVAQHLSVSLTRAHRAAGDAEATANVLLKLASRMPETYSELIRLQTRYAAFQEAMFAARRRPR